MNGPGPKSQIMSRSTFASLLGLFASLLAVERTFPTPVEIRTACPFPCCPAGQRWAQPHSETGEGSVPCPPRGAGELARGQGGRGHAGRMQSPLLVLTRSPGFCPCLRPGRVPPLWGGEGKCPRIPHADLPSPGTLIQQKPQPSRMDAEEGKGGLGAIAFAGPFPFHRCAQLPTNRRRQQPQGGDIIPFPKPQHPASSCPLYLTALLSSGGAASLAVVFPFG